MTEQNRRKVRFIEPIISLGAHKHVEQDWNTFIIMRLQFEAGYSSNQVWVFVCNLIKEPLVLPRLVAVVNQAGTPERIQKA